MKIARDLSKLARPIDEFEPWPDNPRRGDLSAIRASLERFGQLRPIVVQRSSSRIAAGNHLWRAAKDLGATKIAAAVVDLTDTEAKAFLVADNRASELGHTDVPALTRLLDELARAGALDGIGYSSDDVTALLAMNAGEFDPDDAYPPRLDEKALATCPSCGHRFAL